MASAAHARRQPAAIRAERNVVPGAGRRRGQKLVCGVATMRNTLVA